MHSTQANQEQAEVTSVQSLLPTGESRARLRRWRSAKDKISKYGISFAGISVVLAFATIFVYLFSEVGPMFSSASVEQNKTYQSPVQKPLFSSLERYGEIGLSVTDQAELVFYSAQTGEVKQKVQLPLPVGVTVTSFAKADPRTGTLVLGLSDGKAFVVKHEYLLSYPKDQRQINPKVSYPLGLEPVQLDAMGQALTAVAIQEKDENRVLAAFTADGRLLLTTLVAETAFLTGETTVVSTDYQLPDAPASASRLLIDSTFQSLFVADDQGQIHYYSIQDPSHARLVQKVAAVASGQQITALEFLVGTVSLIVGSSDGQLSQWFLVRDEHNNFDLKHIRSFEQHPAAISQIEPEYSRKGFLAIDAKGTLGIHYGTSARTLFLEALDDGIEASQIAVSPINTSLLVLTPQGQTLNYELDNAHPDVSYKALWNEVWYEGRAQGEYIWQASAGSDEFEAKMSMVPLALGTLKAAFFAMLFATPLAIMSAIYVAYFMTPALRGKVKPTIEIMAALPTVILGFLAGLWLAPFVEEYLSAVFAILLLMPFVMLLVAYLWRYMPESVRNKLGLGWEAAILVPVIMLFGYLAVSLSPVIDHSFFGGSLRQWFTDNGMNYDQRNALIVGIAMGFAVIPNIFSIAEDAIFNVPRHLTQGSLALGATPWQTMVGVVLPTASPGVFAAVMVGFGRAVGETMIVLMATGNSPVVNFNIFEGMRTLSANIAVELPETAVGSTHFRVLFLAALVLFVFTFVFNTLAEVIRQRLRQRFSNL
ncbi:ABC transporter permease subunit [Rheinheimera sp.]|uniref:ABC transporter permease subunit n=1 Tax=Rheinheimera sp. TaxID=1869214 RepID=UPI00307E9462